ncbi:MAG: DUF2807 domain-containing protein [Bacteroidales bacterium]|nr:DUF2807 domain-containing protein [Bacteroidales bacterium]
MKKIFLTAAMFVLFANLSIAQTRTLDLGEFTTVNVGQAFQVQLVQSDRNEIIVPESINDDAFSVRDGILRIHGPSNQTGPITVLFTSLDSLIISGTARVSSESEIAGDRLRIRLSGASQARLILAYERVNSTVSGSTLLDLSGTVADMLRIAGTGASSVNTEELKTPRADIHLQGASRARVHTETATGAALGTSVLHLNPEAENLLSIAATARVWPDRRQPSANTEPPARQRNPEGILHDIADYGIIAGVRISTDGTAPTNRPRRFNPRYAGFDFGFGGFGQDFFQNTLPDNYKNMGLSLNQSFVINFHLTDHGIRLGQSNFGIGTSWGFGWNIYRFLDHNIIAGRDSGVFVINQYEGGEKRYRKSNLRSSWFRVPLFIQYRDRNFSVSAGVVGNIRLGASTKQVYRVDGRSGRQRDVNRDHFYLNGFRLDTELRVTYRRMGIFATYSLTPMFRNSRAPELNAFSFGATLLF